MVSASRGFMDQKSWWKSSPSQAGNSRALVLPAPHHQMPSSHILFVCFFVLATLLIRHFHTIHLFKLYNSMVSGIFTELCNHQHNPFLPLQIKPISISVKGQCVDLLLANHPPCNHCFISCSGSSESICIYQKRTWIKKRRNNIASSRNLTCYTENDQEEENLMNTEIFLSEVYDEPSWWSIINYSHCY